MQDEQIVRMGEFGMVTVIVMTEVDGYCRVGVIVSCIDDCTSMVESFNWTAMVGVVAVYPGV